jgi:DNA-binding PadR family transcriptional regulator
MKIHNYTRSLNTIIMKLLEENGKMYGYVNHTKVKPSRWANLTLPKALCILLHKLEAEGILDVEMESGTTTCVKLQTHGENH